MEYKVLTGGNAAELERTVMAWIAMGWEPLGGVSVAAINFYQAMIKRG